MKKRLFLIFVSLISIICLTSCTTTKSIVSNTATLSNYKYATMANVMDYSGSASLMYLEVEIYNILSKTRLEMIGDKDLKDLTQKQKEQLLLVRFAATQNDTESVVSVNFVDYITGKPIASCRGAFGFGLGRNSDMRVAIKRLGQQIKKTLK